MLRPALALLTVLSAAHAPEARPDVLSSLQDEQHALFAKVASGVVVVTNGTAISAGFFPAPGLVVTSAHGVLGAHEVAVTLRDGRTVAGEVIASSPRGLDLALLRVAAVPERVLAPARGAAPRAGDVVVAVGHGDGNRWSFSSGMVSNPQADGPDGALLRLQLALRPGASGGPVVDRAGRVVGVVVHGDPSAVAFAIRADAVLRAFPELAAAAEPEAREAPAPIAAPDEPSAVAPVRAPELIVAPPDPRLAAPRVARVARAAGGRAKPAQAAPSPRREAPPSRPSRREAPRDTGALVQELVPVALVAGGGLALAALVLAGVLGASALGAGRRTAPPRRPPRVRLERRVTFRAASPRALRAARAPRDRDHPPLGR